MKDTREIARIISEAKKTTPCKVYIKGDISLELLRDQPFQSFEGKDFFLLIGDWENIGEWMETNRNRIKEKHISYEARYSALPLKDLSTVEARVEPGAIIREGAEIGKDCIIMMGAVINIGASIGDRTMVDMNAVIGARAAIGKDCHIGAGSVIAGVLEPPSSEPVSIGDSVLVGANAVVLEGVKVEKEAIIAAGSVVLDNVPQGMVVAGIPATIIKRSSEVREEKKSILQELRKR
ncbi:2,3,4,5-tetrahydropyridine-2,6-dicarboxylate N-acetyltransferase [candidate division WOR-3 bacterium]|nr:2,3,4,5-tetrahydropyridine-2,6-dicarboxylate N-acetyltransferase [candidate division WOR-3 bacterium]MCK4528362.1 2,3,4,5-tetrahydropyridine-2,6-dicarboxylate N-acetyltransferase [candidate division WOR-3 bacterium]